MRRMAIIGWLMATGILLGSSSLQAEMALWVVQRETVEETLTIDGVVEPVNQGTASAQTQGRVLRWHVDVDTLVDKGQLLVELDATEQEARQQQARAQLAEARARITEAQQQFDRVRQLFAQGTVPKSQYESADASLQAARARVSAAEAALVEAGRQVSYTRVLAPYAGVVTARHLEVGELATPGAALISGFSLEELRVAATVPQAHADSVRRYSRVVVGLPDGRRITALKPLLFPFADPQNHQFRLRADLPSDSGIVYPGTWVRVWLTVGERQTIRLPRTALVQRDELRAVYVVTDAGRMELRQVRTGRQEDAHIEILAGLRTGESIALDPAAAAAVLGGPADAREAP